MLPISTMKNDLIAGACQGILNHGLGKEHPVSFFINPSASFLEDRTAFRWQHFNAYLLQHPNRGIVDALDSVLGEGFIPASR